MGLCAGNDVITGSGGADTIRGGSGADTLTGGAAGDTFRYTATTDFSGASDTIKDFASGTDKFDWNISNLLSANGTLVDGSAATISTLAGTQTNGTEIYIVSGNAAGPTAAQAITQINAQVTGTDFIAENAAELLLFAVSDGTSTNIWQADVNSAVNDTAITEAELTLVTLLENTASVASGDFI